MKEFQYTMGGNIHWLWILYWLEMWMSKLSSSMYASILSFLFTLNMIWQADWCSHYFDILTMLNCNLTLWSKINPFSLKLLLLGCSITGVWSKLEQMFTFRNDFCDFILGWVSTASLIIAFFHWPKCIFLQHSFFKRLFCVEFRIQVPDTNLSRL